MRQIILWLERSSLIITNIYIFYIAIYFYMPNVYFSIYGYWALAVASHCIRNKLSHHVTPVPIFKRHLKKWYSLAPMPYIFLFVYSVCVVSCISDTFSSSVICCKAGLCYWQFTLCYPHPLSSVFGFSLCLHVQLLSHNVVNHLYSSASSLSFGYCPSFQNC